MWAGNGDSGKDLELQRPGRNFGGNEFGISIAKIAVAQICESEGFQNFQQSALDALSDVAVRYIRELGKVTHFHANLAGRRDCNALDIILGLDSLGSALGFSGASDINHSLSSSGTVRDIRQFISIAEEVPFVFDVPQFPVVKHWKPIQSFSQIKREPPGEHIPAWLPAFPDPDTYVHSSTHKADSRTDEPGPEIRDKNGELSILNLRQQFAGNGLGLPSAGDPGDALKVKQAVASNPFLATPLSFGEKEVSKVFHRAKVLNEAALKVKQAVASNPFLATPLSFGEKEVSKVFHRAKVLNEAVLEYPVTENCISKNHMSVFETLAPAIEVMKSKLSDFGDGGQNIHLNQRPTMRFKIGNQMKSAAVDSSLQKRGVQKISSLFGKNNEKDDTKKRAEEILKKSMENPQELTEL